MVVAWITVVRMALREVVEMCMFEGESQKDLLMDLDIGWQGRWGGQK